MFIKILLYYYRDIRVQITDCKLNYFENITLKSSQFRHALRVTIAMLTGYFVSLFFPLGHGYWILLTIATILKPAYSISRRRNNCGEVQQKRTKRQSGIANRRRAGGSEKSRAHRR